MKTKPKKKEEILTDLIQKPYKQQLNSKMNLHKLLKKPNNVELFLSPSRMVSLLI